MVKLNYQFSAALRQITADRIAIFQDQRGGLKATPLKWIINNKHVPCPGSLLEPDGRPRIGETFYLACLNINGREVITLNAAHFLNGGKFRDGRVEAEPQDQDVQELIEDLKRPEGLELEFKSSLYFPPNPEDKSISFFQIKQIEKQMAAGANSTTHRLRIYVGLKERGDGRGAEVKGIEDEFQLFGVSDSSQFLPLFNNHVLQTLSKEFLMNYEVRFVSYQGHLVMRIDVDNTSGDVVLFGSTKDLFVRINNSVHQIESQAAVLSFIRNFQSTILTQ